MKSKSILPLLTVLFVFVSHATAIEIGFFYVPPFGSDDNLQGKVSGCRSGQL